MRPDRSLGVAEFASSYQLQSTPVTEAPVRSYQAVAHSGSVVMVHFLEDADRADHVLRQLDHLEHDNDVREVLDVAGTPVVVTRFILDFASLDEWLAEKVGQREDEATAPKVGDGPAEDEPGEFTRLFQSPSAGPDAPVVASSVAPGVDPDTGADEGEPRHGQDEASPPADETAGAGHGSHEEPGEFTRLFQAPTRPSGGSDPGSRRERPAADEPDRTRPSSPEVRAGPDDGPPESAPGRTGADADPPDAGGPGEFTRLFQAPSRGLAGAGRSPEERGGAPSSDQKDPSPEPSASTPPPPPPPPPPPTTPPPTTPPPATPPPTTPFPTTPPPGPASSPRTDRPPAPPSPPGPRGSFTKEIQGLPAGGGRDSRSTAGPSEPGEFTRLFRGIDRPGPDAPSEGRPRATDGDDIDYLARLRQPDPTPRGGERRPPPPPPLRDAPPPPPSRAGPSDFTRVVAGQSRAPSPRAPEAATPGPMPPAPSPPRDASRRKLLLGLVGVVAAALLVLAIFATWALLGSGTSDPGADDPAAEVEGTARGDGG